MLLTDHRVAASGLHQHVAGAQHDVEPPVDGGGQVRPLTALDRDRQPFPPEPRRRVDPGPEGSVEHVAARADPLQRAHRRWLVDRGSAIHRAVVEYPVVVGGEAMVGVSHEAQSARQHRLPARWSQANPPSPEGG